MSRSDRDFGDEDFIDYRERRGAHRPKSRGAMAAIPWVLAAVAVLALTFAASQIFGGSPKKDPPVAATGATSSTTPTADSSPDPSAAESPQPTKKPDPPAPKADRTKPIKVLNGTTTSGLAGRVGDVLKKADWKISSVGNYTGAKVSTTIFYGTDSLSASAEAIVSDLGDQGQALKSTKYGSGLTLIVGSDYQE